ncbi:hypothetical protein [Trueperella sp. LYQ143]|uniref:hypothetical protein n=1 Tax=unclassified Trueperella TaxID=2630174 RepID=UPI003983B46D
MMIMDFPPLAFVKTRRFGSAVLASLVLIAAFESFYTESFGTPSFDYAWDTAFSYFLGPFLGCICAIVVNSVAPHMETLAVAPIRLFRAALTVTLCAIQWLGIILMRFVANAFLLQVPISEKDLRTLLVSTLAFQAIGMCSACLFSSLKVEIIPILALLICVGFGYNRDSSPRPYHILVAHTPTTAGIAVVLWFIGIGCLLTVTPSLLEKKS